MKNIKIFIKKKKTKGKKRLAKDQNLTEEEKEKSRLKNLSEEQKQKQVEYRKNYQLTHFNLRSIEEKYIEFPSQVFQIFIVFSCYAL